jgi:hypothetical protein
MNFVKKSLLVFASAGLFAVAPAHAGIISYDFNVMVDTATASLFDQAFAGGLSFDDAQLPAPGFNGEDLYSLPDFSFALAGNVYTHNNLFYDETALLAGQFRGLDLDALEFAFWPASGLFPASFSYDFGPGDAGNGDVTHVPLNGPVPEPSMKWMMLGALLALAGLSRGTHGLHESV